ncbi:MAG: DUF349 domain-containing protein [Bacteroidales bacterium]|nr:DUF349 domain-containing protein [Bacteroidales bacterium]
MNEEPKELNLADKTLAELSDLFRELRESADSMLRSKEAEAIKSAFYKLLVKLRSEAAEAGDKFDEVEEHFKSLYADYKRERAEYNREQDALKAQNLEKKLAIIEELKALIEKEDGVTASFPAFRALQDRWRETGPVPADRFRDVNDTYQFHVEKFYDMVKIDRDLRDLDFKKNLEAKEAFCAAAEKLAENENVVAAFAELQKLHEQWKEYGPVAREYREDIWNRFKAATAVINKKYQAHFEGLKEQQAQNLEAKTALCEQIEEIAARDITTSAEWNALSKEIERIQEEWRKVGFATRKENQKIYERFRAGCDAFFAKKREFYAGFKGEMEENVQKKLAIIEEAERLKDSTEWKKTADALIALQKRWKEVGAVPRKKSEQLWTRFRAACDAFFAERDKSAKPENSYRANLKAKQALLEEIRAYEPKGEAEADAAAMNDFAARWQGIGFVPFKEKELMATAYREAMRDKFPEFRGRRSAPAQQHAPAPARSPKDALIQKYKALQQEVETYENNIGFFSSSKNAEPLIKQMQERIEKAKAELAKMREQIRKAEEGAE